MSYFCACRVAVTVNQQELKINASGNCAHTLPSLTNYFKKFWEALITVSNSSFALSSIS